MKEGLSQFYAYIRSKGVFRPNRYEVVFSVPSLLLDSGKAADLTTDAGTISLTCMNVNIPGFQVLTDENKYGNYVRKTAYDRTMENLETTFLATGEMKERKFFDMWNGMIFKDQHRVEYYANYISSVTIKCFDTADNLIYEIELTEAYPLTVTQLNLDRSELNSTSMFSVSWAFHRIIPSDASVSVNTNNVSGPIDDVVYADLPQDGDALGDFINIVDPQSRSSGFPGGILQNPSSINPIPETKVESILGDIKNGAASVRDTVKGAVKVVNDTLTAVKEGVAPVKEAIKTVTGVIRDLKTIANMPQDIVNSTVGEINSAMRGIEVEIGSIRKPDIKVPKIKIPKVNI